MKMNNWIYWKLRWNLLRMQIPNWNLFRQFSLFDLIELKFLLKLQELLLFKTAQNLKLSRYRWTLRVRNTTATADSLIWDPPCLCNLPQIYTVFLIHPTAIWLNVYYPNSRGSTGGLDRIAIYPESRARRTSILLILISTRLNLLRLRHTFLMAWM